MNSEYRKVPSHYPKRSRLPFVKPPGTSVSNRSLTRTSQEEKRRLQRPSGCTAGPQKSVESGRLVCPESSPNYSLVIPQIEQSRKEACHRAIFSLSFSKMSFMGDRRGSHLRGIPATLRPFQKCHSAVFSRKQR